MDILYENSLLDDITLLNRAWEKRSTFILLPDKSGISEEWIKKGVSYFPEELKKDHFALLTSGSTGQPKLVVGSRERAEALVKILHKLQDSEPVKQTLLALPLSYCFAFVNQWLWSKIFSRKLIITGGFKRPLQFEKSLKEAKYGMLCLVGAQVPLFTQNFGMISYPGIIRLHFAGGLFPQKDVKTLKNFFPNAKIFNNYGCAEAMPRLTIRTLESSNEGNNIGKPLPKIRMKTGESGEILFQSPYGAVAFYDENGFNLIRQEDWVPTGDVGEREDNGCWLINGRTNEVFKRFGEKIALPKLLKTLCAEWVGQAAFYREVDSSGEQGHILILSPKPSNDQIQSILQALRKNYPRTHWPIRLESTDTFPLLPNGKIDLVSLSKIKNKEIHWRQRI